MKIAVCIKRTPDSETRFRIGANARAIDETGVKFDMDDFAGYAVEVALQLKEKQGTGEVVVVAVGPASVQETLRKAMSMGADRAVHLEADSVPFDGLAVAKALAAELKGGGYDLVLFGKGKQFGRGLELQVLKFDFPHRDLVLGKDARAAPCMAGGPGFKWA